MASSMSPVVASAPLSAGPGGTGTSTAMYVHLCICMGIYTHTDMQSHILHKPK